LLQIQEVLGSHLTQTAAIVTEVFVFLLSLSRQLLDEYLKLDNNCSTAHPFKVIIH
jgi:hypothetical protein